jgi:hypothetical protein
MGVGEQHALAASRVDVETVGLAIDEHSNIDLVVFDFDGDGVAEVGGLPSQLLPQREEGVVFGWLGDVDRLWVAGANVSDLEIRIIPLHLRKHADATDVGEEAYEKAFHLKSIKLITRFSLLFSTLGA